MRTYTVSVDSEDFRGGEWNDILIVAAKDEEQAKSLASQHVVDALRYTTDVMLVEAHEYRGGARVLGTLDIE